MAESFLYIFYKAAISHIVTIVCPGERFELKHIVAHAILLLEITVSEH